MKKETKAPLLRDKNLHIIFGITLSAVMGVSSIAPALPSISRSLDVSVEQIGLLITVFSLPGIFLTFFLGIIADRFGRKRILIPSLLLFGIAGTLCGFTTSFNQLLWLRFLQGVGGSALGTLNITLIGDLYSGNRRATAMGYNGSVLSIGTAAYPAIGGALATIGWFYPFFLSALAIPVGIYAAIYLKTNPSENEVTISVYLKRILSSLQSKQVVGLLLANFCTFFILYGGYITYFPILLDQEFNKSSFIIGLLLSASSLITAVVSSQLGKLTLRFTGRRLIITASILYFTIFLMIPSVDSIWAMFIPIILFGVAQGLNIPSILNLLTSEVPSDFRAAFLSVNWMVIRTGQTIAPYFLGLIYVATGIYGTFYFTAGIAFLFIIIATTMIGIRKK